jgi:hypothetical protein
LPERSKCDWNAEEYADQILTEDMPLIETDYALHLVEVLAVVDAVEAAVAADCID